MFSCEFCEIFKNTFFMEHLRTTAFNFCYVDSEIKLNIVIIYNQTRKKIV